jgi:2-(1,2-epoxy-1,2-dihydrophenyl)acetyl-CoA isomerase
LNINKKTKMYETIIFEKSNSIATINLNRPEVFNALNGKILKELHDAFLVCENDEEIRVVVLSGGNNKAFSSGADLKSGLDDNNLGNTLRKNYNPLILCMRNLQKPIICKLNGLAAGAGMSLALACDIIVSDENTYLTELFVGIGLLPDAGSTYFLPRLIGTQKAFELCSTGRKVYAKEALALGLINYSFPTETLNQEVEKLATQYANAATKSIGLMKRLLNQSFSSDLEQMLELEAQAQTQCGFSSDFVEGVMAFLQKRSPKFIGK